MPFIEVIRIFYKQPGPNIYLNEMTELYDSILVKDKSRDTSIEVSKIN